jgi:hypothetical protein
MAIHEVTGMKLIRRFMDTAATAVELTTLDGEVHTIALWPAAGAAVEPPRIVTPTNHGNLVA